jgi:hypothetical protein
MTRGTVHPRLHAAMMITLKEIKIREFQKELESYAGTWNRGVDEIKIKIVALEEEIAQIEQITKGM